MNISPVRNLQNYQYIQHFGNASRIYDGICRSEDLTPYDVYLASKESILNNIKDYLKRMGIKVKNTNDGLLEVSKLDKLAQRRNSTYVGIPTDADYILQFVKTINGSTDFGKIGATTFGMVKTLHGSTFGGDKFDISTSEISNLGSLRKIEGSLYINSEQYRNMKFEGLDVTGDIYISKGNPFGKPEFVKLKKADKDAFLNGFEIIEYLRY